MALIIELLGSPRVVRDAAELRPRGRKSWGLLAYLLLADRPVSRERLAELLFPAADDPLGALRWNQTRLRLVAVRLTRINPRASRVSQWLASAEHIRLKGGDFDDQGNQQSRSCHDK